MKKILILGLLLIFSSQLFSQQDSIVNYLDNIYRVIEKDKASYTETLVKKEYGWLKTVYYRSGKIKFQGIYKNKKSRIKIGYLKRYDEKGNLKSISNYSKKGKKEGEYYYFNDFGEIITEGSYLNDKREGVWNYLDEKKNKRAKVTFKKGKVITYQLWKENGKEFKEELILWKNPQFEGGIKAFKKKLRNQLIVDLKKSDLKTNFIIKCTISEEGNITNPSIIPELEEKHEEKIIGFLKTIKNIEPAIMVNRKVKYTVEMPIIFNKEG